MITAPTAKELVNEIAHLRDTLLRVQDHLSQLSTHSHDGLIVSWVESIYDMIEVNLEVDSRELI